MTNLSICLKNICNDLTLTVICAPRYDCLSGRYVQKIMLEIIIRKL